MSDIVHHTTEVSQKRYRYCGKERDEESGLYYYGARYYAAWLCRFVSVDPRKDDYPMWSSYVYAGNMPVTLTDVNGEGPGDGGDEIGLNANQEESQLPNPVATEITTPDGKVEKHVEGLIPILNSEGQTVAYVVPEGVGAGTYVWRDDGEWRGYFDENNRGYDYYWEWAEMKENDPFTYAIYGAFYDIGQGTLEFISDPVEQTKQIYEGIKNIPNISIEETLKKLSEVDAQDWAKYAVLFGVGILSGPKQFNWLLSKKTIAFFVRGKETLNLIKKSHVVESLKNINIKSYKDILDNPTWLHGKSIDEVVEVLGDGWIKDSKYKSKTGGVRYSDGKGNYISHNPGNPGSQHGGAKWKLTGNKVDGAVWVGGGDFINFAFSGASKSKKTYHLIVD